jgi:membrane protein required for colicin V production
MEPGSIDWRGLSALDLAALALLALAVVRGLWIGVIREAFSLAAIAAAIVALRLGVEPAAAWLMANGPDELSPLAARIGAAVGVAVIALVAVRLLGRLLQRGVHAVGLGFADRIGGGVLGAAEGALILALGILVGSTVLGRDHPVLASSRAVQAFEEVRQQAGLTTQDPTDVAAPPPGR